MVWMGKLPRAASSIKLDFFAGYDLSRDGGTGRRSGLKIRRGSPLVGVQLPLPAPAQKPCRTGVRAIFDLRKTKPLIDPTEIACDALVTGRRRKPAQPGLL